MSKRIKMFMSTLLALCMVLSVVPAEILATESVSATVGEGPFDKVEESVVVPEDAAPLLDANCKILQYVDEEAFAAKGHVARIPGEETLSSYVFRNADGSRTVYYMDEPVKFMDSTGTVREKDLTLIPAVSNDAVSLMGTTAVTGYTTSSNDVGLTLPNDPTNGIRLTYGEDQIALIPQGGTGSATSQINEGAVIYPDYFGKGMSLRYTPTLNGVKEDIILKAYTGVNSFSFLLNTGGLRMYQDSGRYYLAASQNAEIRFDLGDVVTFDAHGRFSVGTMSVETLTMGQSYRLTLTVDEDFLTDENTTYPITIDPTVTVSDNTHGSGAIEDATVYEGAPNLNTGTWMYGHIGNYDSEYGKGHVVCRLTGLLEDDVYQAISADQITSVNFYVTEASGNAAGSVYLYPMYSNSTWTETGITWNNLGAYIGSAYDMVTMASGELVSFDITQLVKDWKTGYRNPQAGFILDASSYNTAVESIYMSEYSDDRSYRPYVTVTYETDIWLDKNIANLAPNGTTTLTASTTQSGASVTWASSDTAVATVASTGTNTCRVTAVRSGVATVTATLSNGQTDSCTVYVSITDGVYFLKNSSLYLSVDGGMISGSTLTLQAKKSSGPAQLRQLWKIEHIGEHNYSIRSMYRPDLVLSKNNDGVVAMSALSPSVSGSSVPGNRRWTISRSGSSYSFQYTGASYMTMQPQAGAPGMSVVLGSEGSTLCYWGLEWDASYEDQLLLINTQNGLPANGCVRNIELGDVADLDDLNLMTSIVSRTKNTHVATWSSSSDSCATVNRMDGTVSSLRRGKTTIFVTSEDTSNVLSYSVVVSETIYVKNYYDSTLVGETTTLGYIENAVDFLNDVYSEDFHISFVMDGTPRHDTHSANDLCSRGEDKPCSSLWADCDSDCSDHHKNVKRIAHEAYDSFFEPNHLVVLWSDSERNVFCVKEGNNHKTLESYGVVCFDVIEEGTGETNGMPVVQILTTSHYDTSNADNPCGIDTFMKIVLAHEVSHTLNLPDVYDDGLHGQHTDDGFQCLMESFDADEVEDLCQSIQNNGSSAFCESCLATLIDVIPENVYED